ncbi:MAG: Flp pilus assembly protein CpaB [Planctomycetales bacterium]
MKFKSVLLLAVAVGCGLVAMLGVRQLLAKPGDKSTQAVFVAKVEIEPGFPLDETNVGEKEMPIDLVPEGAATDWEQIVDRSLKQGAFPDDVITVAKLGDKGQGNASAKIPKGWRVVTVPVDLTKTHSGLILPGDRVDLQLTYKTPTLDAGMVTHTKTFLEFVEVFATDSVRSVDKTSDAEIKSKNISLLVTPEQANLVQLAQSEGQVNLVLRNKDDLDPAKAKTADSRLFGDTRVTMGRIEKEEAPPRSVTRTQEVATFLDQNTVEPPPVPVEVKPTWKLRIFEGGEEKVEEIEYEPKRELALAPAVGGGPASWPGRLLEMIENARGEAGKQQPVPADRPPATSDAGGDAKQ